MLVEHLRNCFTPVETTRTYWIAYSGGLDSHVLLHAMARLREQIPEISLRAIHVHHGLSVKADSWVAHCHNVCAGLGVTLECEHIHEAPEAGESIEAWARTKRYAIFARVLTAGAAVLTAHTQDDQAETVLLQLLRGAGPAGIAAMSARQAFAAGSVLRPLLTFTRRQLQEYAVQHSLVWIEDESNADIRFDRNFLRHRVMPLLRERWPAAASSLARSARHCAEAADGLAELAQQDLRSNFSPNDELEDVLQIATLQALSPARQRNALRYWLSRLGCRLPNTQHIQRIQQDLINGRCDSQPQVSWDKWTIRRYRQALIVTAINQEKKTVDEIPWNLAAPLELPDNLGCLSATRQVNGGLALTVNPERLTIRFRRGGERCRPVGKPYTCSLKKLFQEWQVPPWQRSTTPLLYHDDELAAVIGYCVCLPFAAGFAEMSWQIQWQRV